jgi:hypothetical protein
MSIISEEAFRLGDITKWLLSSDPYIEYNTRVNLLEQKATEQEVIAIKQKMIEHPQNPVIT